MAVSRPGPTRIATWILIAVLLAAARWRRAEDKLHLDEWGLGGCSFGTLIIWFLLGGDLYTAYSFIAVPALVFGVGAVGFFAELALVRSLATITSGTRDRDWADPGRPTAGGRP